MRKHIYFLVFVSILIVACKKKKEILNLPTHTGYYVGHLAFDNYPQYNFSDTFFIFPYKQKYLLIYNRKFQSQMTSDLKGDNSSIYIPNYLFIPDTFPHRFMLKNQKYNKDNITADLYFPINNINSTGTIILNYIPE